jgi:hypothetical protein
MARERRDRNSHGVAVLATLLAIIVIVAFGFGLSQHGAHIVTDNSPSGKAASGSISTGAPRGTPAETTGQQTGATDSTATNAGGR